MNGFLLITACFLPVDVAYVDTHATHPTRAIVTAAAREGLDLRVPDLRSIPGLDQITASAGSEEPEDITVIETSRPAEAASDVHVSRSGIGSLYWAFHHPANAWRAVAPITPVTYP
jgi:hypothetical protein